MKEEICAKTSAKQVKVNLRKKMVYSFRRDDLQLTYKKNPVTSGSRHYDVSNVLLITENFTLDNCCAVS